MRITRLLPTTFCAAWLALLSPSSWAWTDKPVKLVVPAPAGGTMDVIARMLSNQLTADLGQPVVIDNKPGAGGAIGVRAMLSAPADGQTLMVTASNVLTEIPNVMKVPFDPLEDVQPVAQMARANLILVTSTASGLKDLKSLVAHVKSRPGELNYSSYSAGTVSHYAGAILAERNGLNMQHIPFAGSPPALAALLGGQSTLMFDGVVTSKPQIEGGKLYGIALAAPQRSKHLPDVPTMAELGYPEITFGNWLGVVASAKVPAPLVEKIRQSIAKAVANPAVAGRLAAIGFEPAQDISAVEFAKSVKADFLRNADVVKRYNISMK